VSEDDATAATRPLARTAGLHDLLRRALGLHGPDFADATVTGVAQHVAKVEPGHVFVARVGHVVDGHRFVPEALARGAVCVVGTRPELAGIGVPYVRVDDDRYATSALAAAFHDHPAGALTVAGVTGTDGKTTTATLLHHLLQGDREGYHASLLSSALVRVGRVTGALEGHFTTPEATEVHAHLAAARDRGVRVAVLESSSHAVSLQRLAHVPLQLMVWTNLTPEHLDHHGSFEAYREAKVSLVRRAGAAILNRDDPQFPAFADAARRFTSYGLSPEADVRATAIAAEPGALRFVLETAGERRPVRLPMVGDYNVANALAALTAARHLGVAWSTAIARLAGFAGVPGRMQVVCDVPFTVVVDFAHTPTALAKALAALEPAPGGRRLVVVGAAGERDPAKRGPLGAVATRDADVAVFTEEDHRSEDLGGILSAMAAGARAAGGVAGASFHVVPDRRAAIALALRLAAPGDVVLLAGKGHERTLERGAEAIPWDEAVEARTALADLGA
jgi:UDP-N-acetylmuramoyl-L-alanyl-D-glutamate--2,6-diaminopimelate ligase